MVNNKSFFSDVLELTECFITVIIVPLLMTNFITDSILCWCEFYFYSTCLFSSLEKHTGVYELIILLFQVTHLRQTICIQKFTYMKD